MILKEAERQLWKKEHWNITPSIKYNDPYCDELQEKMNTLADSYYTKSQIDTIIQNILDEQVKLNEKKATRYIEENIDILDCSIDDFLDRCPTDCVDVVIRILKDANIITDEDTKRYLGRDAYSKLCKLSSQYGLNGYYQYDLNPPSTITIDTLNLEPANLEPDWIDSLKGTKGTWE